MKILGDSQIPLLVEMFSSLGEVSTYTGRVIAPEQLDGVDVLITRSTLRVDQALLQGSAVKFIGTCTVGVDHVDCDYLDQQGIVWTNAAGCNANSVVQYVLSAMALLAPDWLSASVGIIGCGNIGGRVHRRLRALGVDCYCYDPLLSPSDNPDLCSLEQVLAADIITSHAPLTTQGPHPSFHLLGEEQLRERPRLLISAGRGAVVNNEALRDAMVTSERNGMTSAHRVALDVWEAEPAIDPELLAKVDIATPHIAGHSLEGKQMGTVMVYQALCDFLSIDPPIDPMLLTNRKQAPLTVERLNDAPELAFNRLLLAAYPIESDDRSLREWLGSSSSVESTALADEHRTLAEHFDTLRKHYPIRREYSHFIFPSWAQQPPFSQWLAVLTGENEC